MTRPAQGLQKRISPSSSTIKAGWLNGRALLSGSRFSISGGARQLAKVLGSSPSLVVSFCLGVVLDSLFDVLRPRRCAVEVADYSFAPFCYRVNQRRRNRMHFLC